uniref:Uncharacterized protein n=1 Tax=Knipowitschia caucasica TaxID=637954 RepID=A0AAV2L5K6_KNICA
MPNGLKKHLVSSSEECSSPVQVKEGYAYGLNNSPHELAVLMKPTQSPHHSDHGGNILQRLPWKRLFHVFVNCLKP